MPAPRAVRPLAVEMRHIEKRFGAVRANRDVNLQVAAGTTAEVHGQCRHCTGDVTYRWSIALGPGRVLDCSAGTMQSQNFTLDCPRPGLWVLRLDVEDVHGPGVPDYVNVTFLPGPDAGSTDAGPVLDAGPQLDRYVIDVTRTYVAGTPSAFQRDLYQVVLNAEVRAIARCRPGAEWKDIHFAAAVDLIGGLVGMGVMRGDPQSLVEQDAHTLFYPHGIGHMLGLGVRDGSGLEPGRTKDPRPCLANLRQDLILRPGYIVTIEPGLYFIPALLNDPARRAKFRDCVNWPLAEKHLGLGGVRIEDNILVTVGEPENLTAAIPKGL